MLNRDAGVQLPHLASLSGLSQPPPAPVSLPAALLHLIWSFAIFFQHIVYKCYEKAENKLILSY